MQGAIERYGKPSSCRGQSNHAVFTCQRRGIVIDAWTYDGMPVDENGCISPDLIHISEIRLTGSRWTTSRHLRIGDTTLKLRRLYPHASYYRSETPPRGEYGLVTAHGPCIGVCSEYEDRHGVDYSRLTAQVKDGKVIGFVVPVSGQGE